MDHAVGVLPSLLKSSLASALSTSEGVLHPEAVSDVLVKGISAFDDSITSDFLDLFSGGPDALSKYSDDEIRDIINDSQSGGRNSAKVLRCMRGSTVLISLIDPSSSQLWVASLGDCQAGSTKFAFPLAQIVHVIHLSARIQGIIVRVESVDIELQPQWQGPIGERPSKIPTSR